MPNLAFRRNIERGCFFIVERTARLEVHSRLLHLQITGNDFHDIQARFYLVNIVGHGGMTRKGRFYRLVRSVYEFTDCTTKIRKDYSFSLPAISALFLFSSGMISSLTFSRRPSLWVIFIKSSSTSFSISPISSGSCASPILSRKSVIRA